jgi:hypothetical protein
MVISPQRRRRSAALPILLVTVGLGVAACGGSSNGTTSNSTSTTKSSTSTTPTQGARASRFAALRQCLQREGITLPQRPSGSARPNGGAPGGFFGGPGATRTFQLPNGVSRSKYEAALKKCGGTSLGGRRNFSSTAVKQELTKFASCMREDGINLPAPNTSGNGPVFNTKGVQTNSARFKTAEGKCASDLPAGFGRRAGRAPGTGAATRPETSTG